MSGFDENLNDLDLFADENEQGVAIEAVIIEKKDHHSAVVMLEKGIERLEKGVTCYTAEAEKLIAVADELNVIDGISLADAANIQLLAAAGIAKIKEETEDYIIQANGLHKYGTGKRKAVVDLFNDAAERSKKKADIFRIEQRKKDEALQYEADQKRKAAIAAEKERLRREAGLVQKKADDDRRKSRENEEKKIRDLQSQIIGPGVGENIAGNEAAEKEAARLKLEVESKIEMVRNMAEVQRKEIEAAAAEKENELNELRENVYIPPTEVPAMGAKIVSAAGSVKAEFVLEIGSVYSVREVAAAVLAGTFPISAITVNEKELLSFLNATNKAEPGTFRAGQRINGISIGQRIKETVRKKK
jgi:hypothetical protein